MKTNTVRIVIALVAFAVAAPVAAQNNPGKSGAQKLDGLSKPKRAPAHKSQGVIGEEGRKTRAELKGQRSAAKPRQAPAHKSQAIIGEEGSMAAKSRRAPAHKSDGIIGPIDSKAAR